MDLKKSLSDLFRWILYPFSLLYGLILALRNLIYDTGLLTAVSFDLPCIGVGNLSVGGTGKTTMVEYLIGVLGTKYPLAILSRGYGRLNHGYYLAGQDSTALDLGDEPMQLHLKFPDLPVAVGEDRVLAIPQLLQDAPQTEVILLDDAFQHRSILPGCQILLSDYSRLYTRDHILPFGRLRDRRASARRAQGIIVSKCPEDLDTLRRDRILAELRPLPGQEVFFTTLQYGPLKEWGSGKVLSPDPGSSVWMLSAIAYPTPMLQYLDRGFQLKGNFLFRDHHFFSWKDMEEIREEIEMDPSEEKYIITTEKDAVRLRLLKDKLEREPLPFLILPVYTRFLFGDQERFSRFLLGYIGRFGQGLQESEP